MFGVLSAVLLGACASAPPPPPKQVLEYQRHTSVGLEKHAQGYVAQAKASFQRALTHAEVDDSAGRIASALINLGGIELLLDDAEAAGRAYGRAAREAGTVRASALEWQAQNGLAEATRRLGHPAKALELYAARRDPGPGVAEPLVLSAEIGRARAMADLGRLPDALSILDRVDAAAGRAGAVAIEAASLHARASMLLAVHRHDEALVAAKIALDKDRSTHHPPSVGEDHRLIGEILRALGRHEDAAMHQDRARQIFTHTGQHSRLR